MDLECDLTSLFVVLTVLLMADPNAAGKGAGLPACCRHRKCSVLQDQLSRALTWAAEASDPARPGAWLYHEGEVSSGFLSSPSCRALAVCSSQFFQLYFLLPGGQFTAPLLFSSLCVSLSCPFLDSPGPDASQERPFSLLSTH